MEAIVKQTLTRVEAAAYLGIHVNTLDLSDIPRLRIGGRVLFRKATLDNVMVEGEQGEFGRRPKCRKKKTSQ